MIGLIGRAAASAPQFSYTTALRDSKLTWDVATLKRFLSAPTSVVPGTSMLLAVPGESDRDNLIAYFQGVSNQAAPAESSIVVPASSTQSANWRLDAPGRLHRINANSLPPAFATPSSRNNASVVPKPSNATLAVPPGFHVATFISTLTGPRKMLVAANGARLGAVYRVGPDGSAQIIIDGKLVTVPANTISIADGKLTTSLTKSEVIALH